MQNTNGLTMRFTKHARQQMEAKQFSWSTVRNGFAEATAENNTIYPNKKFEGQFRIIAGNVCLIGKPQNGVFIVFTVYEDGVMTPPRPDQLETPQGRMYAKRYGQVWKTGGIKRDNEYWPRVHRRNSEIRHAQTN